MPSSRETGLLLLGLGLLVALAGLLVWAGALSWFGRLPGDLRFQSGGTRVYVPITSMLIVSAVLTLLLNLVRRLF